MLASTLPSAPAAAAASALATVSGDVIRAFKPSTKLLRKLRDGSDGAAEGGDANTPGAAAAAAAAAATASSCIAMLTGLFKERDDVSKQYLECTRQHKWQRCADFEKMRVECCAPGNGGHGTPSWSSSKLNFGRVHFKK